jgi:hypothetical protein
MLPAPGLKVKPRRAAPDVRPIAAYSDLSASTGSILVIRSAGK